MKRKIILTLLVVALALLSYSVIASNHEAAFDIQSVELMFVRLNAWIAAVTFYRALAAALGDDDLEADWDRINDGNIAVSLYRLTEFAVVGIATAMLISKI